MNLINELTYLIIHTVKSIESVRKVSIIRNKLSETVINYYSHHYWFYLPSSVVFQELQLLHLLSLCQEVSLPTVIIKQIILRVQLRR